MRETDPNKMSNTEWERWAEARIAELEAENALEKKRNRELEAENLSFARECNLVADEKKELKEENQRLREAARDAVLEWREVIRGDFDGVTGGNTDDVTERLGALLGGGDE